MTTNGTLKPARTTTEASGAPCVSASELRTHTQPRQRREELKDEEHGRARSSGEMRGASAQGERVPARRAQGSERLSSRPRKTPREMKRGCGCVAEHSLSFQAQTDPGLSKALAPAHE
eukprot:2842446-Rhodomonas_salina.1